MIRGLDGDETVFLDLVAKQQEEIASRRFDEESQEIKNYRVWLMCGNIHCGMSSVIIWVSVVLKRTAVGDSD